SGELQELAFDTAHNRLLGVQRFRDALSSVDPDDGTSTRIDDVALGKNTNPSVPADIEEPTAVVRHPLFDSLLVRNQESFYSLAFATADRDRVGGGAFLTYLALDPKRVELVVLDALVTPRLAGQQFPPGISSRAISGDGLGAGPVMDRPHGLVV